MNIFGSDFKPASKHLRNKMNAINKIIYDETYTISNLSELFFDKLKSAKNVCIIGNGPVSKSIKHLLEKFDVIIRFNNYIKDTDKDLVGERTDVQFICLQNLDQTGWIEHCNCAIAFEIARPQHFKKLKDPFKSLIVVPPMSYIKSMKNICDMSRGFFAIASCLQIKNNINKELNIYIFGFGGKGHHFNKKHHISHYHNEEQKLIGKLKNRNLIIDLKDENCETIVIPQ